MSLIQLLKFKKWETRLFKMPRLETPRFQTGTRVTVASGLSLYINAMNRTDFNHLVKYAQRQLLPLFSFGNEAFPNEAF